MQTLSKFVGENCTLIHVHVPIAIVLIVGLVLRKLLISAQNLLKLIHIINF